MKCLNWKVLAALAAVGVGVYALAPNLVTAATPLLVLALCPLSMLLMMRAMGSGSAKSCEMPSNGTDTSEELAQLRAEVAELNRRQARPEHRPGRS